MRRSSPLTMATPFACLLFLALLLTGCGGGGGGSDSSTDNGSSNNGNGGGGNPTPVQPVVPHGTNIVLLGDPTNSNTSQLIQTLTTQDGYTVTTYPGFTLQAEDAALHTAVTVVDESAQLYSSDANFVNQALSGGKNFVLIGRVPAVLATGSKTLPADLTPISLWFGGATQMDPATDNIFGFSLFLQNNTSVKLPAGHSSGDDIYDSTNTDFADPNNPVPYIPDTLIGANASQFVHSNGSGVYAMAYQTSGGGRVYWQWSPTGTNSNDFTSVKATFFNGVFWAAGLQQPLARRASARHSGGS